MTRDRNTEGPNTISIHRSFIVRFFPDIDPHAGEISGWIEHIVSGEAAEFRSVEELLRLIDLMLRRVDSTDQ